jgi:hypothetical protein
MKLATALVVIVAGVALASMSSSTVFAQAPPNFAGQVTSNFAREGSNTDPEVSIGDHASDPTGQGPNTPTGGNDHGRNGLANALTGRGEPQHPSEVINTLCGSVSSGQFGYP